MNTRTAPAALALPSTAPAAARVVFKLLKGLAHGTLDVQLPDGAMAHFGSGHGADGRASLRLIDWQVCGAVLRSGDIGFAEGWIAGHWTTPDLAALLRLFIANRDAVERAIYGSWWGSLLPRLRHLLNRNSRRGAARNIHAHYDIGNSFYRLWLDETMNYSSALFDGDAARSSAAAQQAKMRRALAACQVRPGQRLLEIGCGWGALAEAATADWGLRVTGVTLSDEQLGHARERLAQRGLRADLRREDYRDIDDGPYDAVVSIEMFEAVGHAYWDDFFATVHSQLKPGGHACIQTIVIRDDLFDRYRRSTDFIQQYIFPGGMLPSRAAFRGHAERARLEVLDAHPFGADYAETLRRWRIQFLAHEPQMREMDFDTRFIRIWEFYLAYCEAAFAEGNTDVVQFTLRRSAV